MAAVDRKDYDFYSRLNNEQRKSLNLWMTQRYASSVQGKYAGHYLVMINEFMNTNWSDVSKHPELQWKLMCLAGCGKIQFHIININYYIYSTHIGIMFVKFFFWTDTFGRFVKDPNLKGQVWRSGRASRKP